MKKITTLFAFVCAAHMAHAIGGASQLSLRLFDNAPFAVTFDNQQYANQSSTYKFQEVVPGHHFIRVTKMVPYGFGWGNILKPVNIYEGWIDVPVATDINAMINNYNQYTVVSMFPMYDPGYGNYGGNYGGNCGNGNNYGNGYGNGNWGYPMGMNPNDFQALKNSVSKQSYDDSRLTIAKQGVVGGITAAQVGELMKLMSYESTKLDFAKFAYPKTVDRQNYFRVNDAFTYSSSVDDLAKYIAGSNLPVNNTGAYGNGYSNGYGNGYGNWNFNMGMPAADFQALKASISKQSFDDSKLTIAKQGIAGGATSAQIAELMGQLTYESSKLDLAKYAYKKAVDKQNYFWVNDAFDYSSSIDELARYLGTI